MSTLSDCVFALIFWCALYYYSIFIIYIYISPFFVCFASFRGVFPSFSLFFCQRVSPHTNPFYLLVITDARYPWRPFSHGGSSSASRTLSGKPARFAPCIVATPSLQSGRTMLALVARHLCTGHIPISPAYTGASGREVSPGRSRVSTGGGGR